MSSCAVPLGSCCCGVPIKLHCSFLVLLALELAATLKFREPSYTILVFAVSGPVLLGSLVLNLLGSALVNKKFGGTVEEIVLWPFVGFATMGPTDGQDVIEDFWVGLAGPLVNIPLIALWFALFLAVGGTPSSFEPFGYIYLDELLTVKGWLAELSQSSTRLIAMLFAINLLPAYPLNGGRCLAALLVKCGTPVPKAAMITSITAMILAVGIVLYGVIGLVLDANGGGGVLLILAGLWVLYSSHNLYHLTQDGRVHDHPMFAKECYRRAGTDPDHMEREDATRSSSETADPPVANNFPETGPGAALTTNGSSVVSDIPGWELTGPSLSSSPVEHPEVDPTPTWLGPSANVSSSTAEPQKEKAVGGTSLSLTQRIGDFFKRTFTRAKEKEDSESTKREVV